VRYERGTLVCKSVEPYYSDERAGLKPNTVRVVPNDELVALARCKRIIVWLVDVEDQEVENFGRDITHIVDITEPMTWGEGVGPEGVALGEVCGGPRE